MVFKEILSGYPEAQKMYVGTYTRELSSFQDEDNRLC